MPHLHMPLQSGSDTMLQGHAPLLPAGPLPRHHRPGARGHAGRGDHHRHHRRLPRRDRGGLQRRPSTWCARRGSPARSPSSTRSAAAPPPRRWTTRCRRRSCRSATSGSWPWSGDLLGGEPAAGRPGRRGARRGGRGPQGRRARTACPAAPATTGSSTSPRTAPARARATWSPSTSPTPRRTTWSPTGGRARSGGRVPVTPGPSARAVLKLLNGARLTSPPARDVPVSAGGARYAGAVPPAVTSAAP